jgi:heterodisulfide reductase subunit D
MGNLMVELDKIFAEKLEKSNLTKFSQENLKVVFDRCVKCGTCKLSSKDFLASCPSGEKFLWESYWASGRIRLARGLLFGELEWNADVMEPIFACTTCGSCQVSCEAPHQDQIVDIIESLRELAVQNMGALESQKPLVTRTQKEQNPYGITHSDNTSLKQVHNLPDVADVVYFIGCTSNYRQQKIRDDTIKVLKALNVNFTLIDEYCCGSPLIRTGQLNLVNGLMKHNIEQFNMVNAKTIITSCAGCYRTLKKDFPKFGNDYDQEILHVCEYILKKVPTELLLDKIGKLSKGKSKKIVTYHDPCHLGRHLGVYEAPRQLISLLPGLELNEMTRNRDKAWCCGAGGGVKIAWPDWATEISGDRLNEATETGAEMIISTCPFCKTNLSDANEKFQKGFKVIDLIEVLASII